MEVVLELQNDMCVSNRFSCLVVDIVLFLWEYSMKDVMYVSCQHQLNLPEVISRTRERYVTVVSRLALEA